jgi:hypothetical protein
MEVNAFRLGSVIVPAHDGMLRALGYDVESLGLRALGIVIEAKAKKSLVNFPELNITLWIPHDEMVDIEAAAAKGDAAYLALLPDFGSRALPEHIVWWMWKLCRDLSPDFVLGIETGDLVEIFDQEDQPLEHYYRGPVDVPACYLGLGVAEFFPEKWKEVERWLSDRLLFTRFLPAGLHKMEVALYLKR